MEEVNNLLIKLNSAGTAKKLKLPASTQVELDEIDLNNLSFEPTIETPAFAGKERISLIILMPKDNFVHPLLRMLLFIIDFYSQHSKTVLSSGSESLGFAVSVQFEDDPANHARIEVQFDVQQYWEFKPIKKGVAWQSKQWGLDVS